MEGAGSAVNDAKGPRRGAIPRCANRPVSTRMTFWRGTGGEGGLRASNVMVIASPSAMISPRTPAGLVLSVCFHVESISPLTAAAKRGTFKRIGGLHGDAGRLHCGSVRSPNGAAVKALGGATQLLVNERFERGARDKHPSTSTRTAGRRQ